MEDSLSAETLGEGDAAKVAKSVTARVAAGNYVLLFQC
jgi:hypothetical protein